MKTLRCKLSDQDVMVFADGDVLEVVLADQKAVVSLLDGELSVAFYEILPPEPKPEPKPKGVKKYSKKSKPAPVPVEVNYGDPGRDFEAL